MKKRRMEIRGIIIIIIGITVTTALLFTKKNQEAQKSRHETYYETYCEMTAEYGMLARGITKTAPCTLGVAEQTWELDIGTVTDANSVSEGLQIEEVLVSAGQQVHKGTALFRVTSDSVQNVRSALQKEILDTNRACELLEARQKELQLQASQGYDSDIIDGKYADLTYSSKCDALQKKADDTKEAVDYRQNQVNENLLELAQAQQELWDAQKYLREAEAAVSENYENRYRDAYSYAVYGKTMETAENRASQLEKKVENLTEKNETLLYEVDEAVRAYHQIVQELEKEKLAAKMERDADLYSSEMASEWYDIQTAGIDEALEQARQRYQTALRNIRAFNASIVRGQILSRYNGPILDITAEAGDAVNKNDTLVIFCDQTAVAAEVLLSEEEYLATDTDKAVNIVFSQYPDKIYEGRITETLKMESDANATNSCYKVKVTVQGAVEGLFEDKVCDVTFLTGEMRQALYVPKNAVYTKGRRSYVKMRSADGTIREKNVKTGFSDGIHIEIVKGISQGDLVLVEAD